MPLQPASAAAAAAMASRRRRRRTEMRLPNGLAVRCVSRRDVLFLYKEVFERQAYLQHGASLEPGGTVLDVGANIGLFALFAAELLGPEVSQWASGLLVPGCWGCAGGESEGLR